MTVKTAFRLSFVGCAFLALAMLSGCGEDESSKDKSKTRIPRIAVVTQRLEQLNSTLDSMQRDSELHQQRIATAKTELVKIQQELASIATAPGRTPITTSTALIRSRDIEKQDREAVADGKKDDHPILRVLLMLAGTAFVVIYLAKLWRDRTEAPDTPEDTRPWEPAKSDSDSASSSGSSFTYPDKVEPPQQPGSNFTPYQPSTEAEKKETPPDKPPVVD